MRQIILALVLLAICAPPTRAAAPFAGRITQGYSAHHRGIDIAAPRGTIVGSIERGMVVFAGWRRNCGGWQVYVKGYHHFTTYNHLGRILVKPGDTLVAGTPLGRVGASGVPPRAMPHKRCTTGPHLHLEVWIGYPWARGSRRVNPTPYVWPHRHILRGPRR